ncbi:hypothetical protein [Nocardioides mangrovi]|uniref:DUF2079 domain-containing protein n=1 Tax=Nocardioides mangrovi TaxID=2874580 RepID=A0ABS7U816_9ACTN|nr:hypothetical protein [Nocardioides mangrovi]MBZ5736881.1 hypothetical protein [Nocardioides mangrovi]
MTAASTEPTTEPTAERRRPRETWVLAAALALIVVHLAYRAWATYGGWLHIDDFNFISRMFHDGLAPSVAARSYYGHVMPAAMYLSWLNQSVSPWNFLLPATEMVVLQALCDLGMLYLLRTLFGLRPGILPPLALFLASVISLEASIWWAAAVNLLPLQIALFFGLAAHVVYLRTGQLRHAVAANLWIAVGIAFNEKTALVYGVLGIVTLCYFATGRSPVARVRSAIRGRLSALAIYIATGAAYVAVYLLVGRDFRASAPVSYPVLGTLDKMVREAYVPALLGGPVRWWRVPEQPFSFAQPGDAVAYLALALVLVLLWEIRKHRRRSLRGLWVPGYFLLIDVALVLLTRASVSGPLVGLDYRFQGELAAATAIGLACMTMPIIGATESSERRSESEFLDHPRRVAVATAGVVALSAVSTWTYMSYWHDDTRGEQWFDALVPQLRSSTTPIPVVDAIVPYFVTNGVRYPENLQSRVLSGETTLAYTRVATDRLDMIDDEGQIVPVAIPPTREARKGPDGKCGWKVQEGSVTIPLNGPVAYGGWWVRIGYLGSADSPVRVVAGNVTRDTTVKAGVHALYFEGGPQFRSITIGGLGSGVTLCTNDITVGRAVPSTELEKLIQQDLRNEALNPRTDQDDDENDEQGD